MTQTGLTVWRLSPDGASPAADEASWFMLAPHGATPHPQLLDLLLQHAAARPDLDIVYGNAVAQDGPATPLDRPDFDLTRLIAQDYIGLPIAIHGRALSMLGGLDATAASAGGYDLLLRGMAGGVGIGRMDQVLAVPSPPASQAMQADLMAVRRRFLAANRPDCTATPGLLPGAAEIRRMVPDPPPVTVVVLPDPHSRTAGDPLPGLLQSLGRTDWPMDRLHIVLEDRPDLDTPTPFALRSLSGLPPASLEARINRLWRSSETEHVILLDPAIATDDPAWLRALMTFAMEEGVGALGPRLVDPDGAVVDQPGLGMAFAPDMTDAGVAHVQHQRAAIPGDVFATRRSVLEHANGLDDRFGADAGVLDLCLRLRMLGLRIIHTPHARMTRRRPAPYDPPGPVQTALFLEKWPHVLAAQPGWRDKAPFRRATPGARMWFSPPAGA